MKNRRSWLLVVLAVTLGLLAFQFLTRGQDDSTKVEQSSTTNTPKQGRTLETTPTETATPVRLKIQSDWVRGKIVDASGWGIADARIHLLDENSAALGKTIGEDSGEFSFPGIKPAGQILVAEAPGFSEAKLQLANSNPVTIVLSPRTETILISGTVSLQNGSHPESFQVQVSFQKRGATISGPSQSFREPSGFFQMAAPFDRQPGQQLSISVISPGFRPVMKGPFAASSGTNIEGLEITLTAPSKKVAGAVYSENGAPIEGAVVIPYNDLGGEEERLTTNAQGYFELLSSRRLVKALVVLKEGFAKKRFRGEGLNAGEGWENLTLVLEKGGMLYGIVVDERSQPVPDTTIQARSKPEPGQAFSDWSASSKTNAQGYYQISDVPAGQIVVGRLTTNKKSAAKNLQDLRQFSFSAKGTLQEDFMILQDAVVRGKIRFPESPTLACWVELRQGGDGDSGIRLASSHCDQNEEFQLDCYSGSSYVLRIFIGADNYIDKDIHVQGNSLDLGELRLDQKDFREAFNRRKGK